MAFGLNLFRRFVHASITNKRDLGFYVVRVTVACLIAAMSADVTNQLTFFVDWPTAFRSWCITAGITIAAAAFFSRVLGNAHLELYRAKSRAEELSRTDQLTGLPNRRALMDAVHAARPETLALVIIDIDRFKRVNDTHGHLAGDAVIKAVGQMMATELGVLGQVARMGGEEFALLSSGVPPQSLVGKLAAFRERVENTPILCGGAIVQVTISAGVSLRGVGDSFDQLFSEADRALYLAKTSGRNRIRLSSALEALCGQGVDAIDRAGLDPDPILRSA